MSISFDLKKLFNMPAAYENFDSYFVDNSQIAGFGVLPPRYTIGFNATIMQEPYIKTHDGAVIRLTDDAHNHKGINELGMVFSAEDFLTEVSNLPENVNLDEETQRDVVEAKNCITAFLQNYGSMDAVKTAENNKPKAGNNTHKKPDTKQGPAPAIL